MNDPGLHKDINSASQNVQQAFGRDEDEMSEQEDERAFLDPSRWWMASTAFPLMAGTFGPMASAFNICALSVHWRVSIPPGPGANEANGVDLNDPGCNHIFEICISLVAPYMITGADCRLLAVNGVSLFFAIVSNFALLLNMTRRLSFSVAQPITIVGWYIASLLLIGDISGIIHVVRAPGERRALTQAYYYAIFAATIYFIIASLMLVTVRGARQGHYPKEFRLTMSQRTLMLQTISFLVYMVGGAGVYARIEGWQFLDSVYFTNFTLLTIGIGNFAPKTHLGRSLLFPYAVVGIVILGLVIGSIRSMGLEHGKNKLDDRMTEKRRERLVNQLEKKGNVDILVPISSDARADKLGMSERQRREQEFRLMRQVQDEISSRQKWVALAISGGAWLFLWLIGALIFFFAEREQEWTYFVSIYFSYTSLLTIGYGDYAPLSNSGKPFFVLWSLLAVPTLTIVISNMGDTVVKSIRDVTLYLGEFTILPGELQVKAKLKRTAQSLAKGNFPSGIAENEPPGLASGKGAGEARPTDDNSSEEKETDSSGLPHSYHHAIAREIRNVMRHRSEEPPRRYSYQEWAHFLKLLGEDEDSADSHRQAPAKPKRKPPAAGQERESDITDGVPAHSAGGKTEPVAAWSWLGDRSPLMLDMEEPEWVLDRLVKKLERELRTLSRSKTSSSS